MRYHEAVSTGAVGASETGRSEIVDRRPWVSPVIDPLSPLTALTMNSIQGAGILGDGGASTVF